MAKEFIRREILKAGLAAASLAAIPEWAIPALAQGETLVPFTDIPDGLVFINLPPGNPRRYLDIRTIEGFFTPKEQFFVQNNYGHPEVDPSTYRLKITGLVDTPTKFSLADLRARPSRQLAAGYECSGNNNARIQGLASNGLWTGIRVSDLLTERGVGSDRQGKEVVFFGADHGEEEINFRGQIFNVDQQFARSISLDKAMTPDPFLAYELNGDPLTKEQGFPLRLIMPGWYGITNVKWVSQVHVQEGRYLGKWQARRYFTLRREVVDGEVKWMETAVTRMRLKSVIARVTIDGNRHKVLGFALNDGTPLRSVEVKVDDGEWQPATFDSSNTQYSWKLFTYQWEGATPGEHTLVSRVTDSAGNVQPVEADLENKLTRLEHNAQFPRTVMIS